MGRETRSGQRFSGGSMGIQVHGLYQLFLTVVWFTDGARDPAHFSEWVALIKGLGSCGHRRAISEFETLAENEP